MKLTKIHLFFILLIALIFCSCLGNSYMESMSGIRTVEGMSGIRTVEGMSGIRTVEGMSSQRTVTTYNSNNGQAAVVSGPQGQAVVATTDNTVNGIQSNDIPSGQSDLYILKSEVVPPVCPVCPAAATCPRQKSCPPCPPCARCPEPAFECKKVPNYASTNDNYLPRPVLSDFSQFGM